MKKFIAFSLLFFAFILAKSQSNDTDSIARSILTIPSQMDYSESTVKQENEVKLQQKAIKYDAKREIEIEKIAAQKKETLEKNTNNSKSSNASLNKPKKNK